MARGLFVFAGMISDTPSIPPIVLPVIGLQPMKRFILVFGIFLIAVGVLGLIHPRVTYNSTEEVAKIGPVQAKVTHEKTVEVPLGLPILLLVTGVGLAIFGTKSLTSTK
jgi:hypothetical protein